MARSAVAQQFDQELTVRALEDAYEEVCARPAGAGTDETGECSACARG